MKSSLDMGGLPGELATLISLILGNLISGIQARCRPISVLTISSNADGHTRLTSRDSIALTSQPHAGQRDSGTSKGAFVLLA